MKVRHIKRRNHPVYDLDLVMPEPGPEFDRHPSGYYVLEGVNLEEFRQFTGFTFQRVRRTWSRPQRAD